MEIFRDRSDAGRQLAEKLLEYKVRNPAILALPRGGVPVAYEVAKAMGASLDTIVVRKIGMPSNPEFGVGAIAPGDILILDAEVMRSLVIKQEDLKDVIEEEKKELERRKTKYNSGQWNKDAIFDTVIVVDDGLATGVTARAALQSARAIYRPKKLIFAAPVCARDSLQLLRPYADSVVCVIEPLYLAAIGEWYKDFRQTSDEEVLYYLQKAYEEKKRLRK